LYVGDGAGGFSQRPLELEGAAPRLFAGAGDYTSDGRPDLFAIARDGTARVYEGSGDSRFAMHALSSGWEGVRFLD
jgi:hypothetical protein